MTTEPLIYFIQQHIPASQTVVSQIAAQFHEKVILKHDYLLRAGTVSNEYFFLTDGCLRAFTHDANGRDVTTNFFTNNRAVFEVSSLFLRLPSTENIQALSDSRGYCLSFETLNQLFHSIPEFREFGRLMLVKEFATFKQRSLSLINQTAEERYLDLMTTDRDVFRYAQLRQIASYLGITDTSLSRIRRELTRK